MLVLDKKHTKKNNLLIVKLESLEHGATELSSISPHTVFNQQPGITAVGVCLLSDSAFFVEKG